MHLEWSEIAMRLLCTVAAGFLIGLDRGEHGRPAGLRTTILVALAASLAMLQANLLMATAGKPADSFVVLDLMRLPLGILSGMGFIGAGAIIRRDNAVLGVTTAATLWFVTVLGLCFGGGQIGLGFGGLLIGVVVLTGMRYFERRIKQDRQGTLTVIAAADGPSEGEVRARLSAQQYKIISCAVTYAGALSVQSPGSHELTCQVSWRASVRDTGVPEIVHALSNSSGVLKVAWAPQISGHS
jgi:putative Mg2+ transporter-C (MgtC) family protein